MSEQYTNGDKLKTRVKFTLNKVPVKNYNQPRIKVPEDVVEDISIEHQSISNQIKEDEYQKNYAREYERHKKNNKGKNISNIIDQKKRKADDVMESHRDKVIPVEQVLGKISGNKTNGNGHNHPISEVKFSFKNKQISDESQGPKRKEEIRLPDTSEKICLQMIKNMHLDTESKSMVVLKKTILVVSDLIETIEEKKDVDQIERGMREYQMSLRNLAAVADEGKGNDNILLMDVLQADEMGINPMDFMRDSTEGYIGLCEDMIEKKKKFNMFKMIAEQLKKSSKEMYPEEFREYNGRKPNGNEDNI